MGKSNIATYFRELLNLDTKEGKIELIAATLEVSVINQVISAMENVGMSKRKLAKKMGISKRDLNTILSLDTDITMKILAQFQDALGVKFDIKLQDMF